MSVVCFLGATTPQGFRSFYDTLFQDPRLERILILKGGAGCGKSTLMKAVGEEAERLGLSTQRVLCSSDPDSLDGLLIPAAGLALVDGTAPHVVEPPLCACGAEYVDLGRYYDSRKLKPVQDALFALREENARQYGLATACFRSAQSISDVLLQLAQSVITPQELNTCAALLVPQTEQQEESRTVPRFLAAFTPKGIRVCRSAMEQLCTRRLALLDDYGLHRQLFSQLQTLWGGSHLAGYEPLHPEVPFALLFPGQDTACVASSRLFPCHREAACVCDLNTLVERRLSARQREHALAAQTHRAALVNEGLSYLTQAKALHDRMEQLYRPAVDFDGVTAITESIKKALERRIRH